MGHARSSRPGVGTKGVCPSVTGGGGQARSAVACPRDMLILQNNLGGLQNNPGLLHDSLSGACPFFEVRTGHRGIMSTGRGQGRACSFSSAVSAGHAHSSRPGVGTRGLCPLGAGRGGHVPSGRTRLSAPPPRLRYTMDMLFDPYADGPFQAASKAAAGTKSRSGSGLAGLIRTGFRPEGHRRRRPHGAAGARTAAGAAARRRPARRQRARRRP